MMMVKFPKVGIVVPKPTGFKKKILSGEKRHTIRHSYEFWKKRIDEINAGRAILSVRQWSGRPYNSKQKEIKQFKQGEVSYQSVAITGQASDVGIQQSSGGYKLLSNKKIKTLAENDGVTLKQFQSFFKGGVLDGIIIHFTTKTRY